MHDVSFLEIFYRIVFGKEEKLKRGQSNMVTTADNWKVAMNDCQKAFTNFQAKKLSRLHSFILLSFKLDSSAPFSKSKTMSSTIKKSKNSLLFKIKLDFLFLSL